MSARYVTWIDGEEATVDLIDRQGSRVRAVIEDAEGARREVSFEVLDHHGAARFTLRMPDGRVQESLVARGERATTVRRGFEATSVRVMSERDAWLAGDDAGAGENAVTVAMPGRVVKVLAAVGEAVVQGQPVLIIEAMKMENEVKAGRDGEVVAIHVAAGDSVEADAILMEIG